MGDRQPLGANRHIVIFQTADGWGYKLENDPKFAGRSFGQPTQDSAKSFDGLIDLVKKIIRTDLP